MVLIVFFTRAVSLEVWLNKGLLDREKLVYEEYLKSGVFSKVYWITYGSNDNKISEIIKSHGGLVHEVSDWTETYDILNRNYI